MRLLVDRCETVVINEDERSRTSVVDYRPCEAVSEIPGDSLFVSVTQPLQIGGRANPWASYPTLASREGFHGCIKNLVHNGEVGKVFFPGLIKPILGIIYQPIILSGTRWLIV